METSNTMSPDRQNRGESSISTAGTNQSAFLSTAFRIKWLQRSNASESALIKIRLAGKRWKCNETGSNRQFITFFRHTFTTTKEIAVFRHFSAYTQKKFLLWALAVRPASMWYFLLQTSEGTTRRTHCLVQKRPSCGRIWLEFRTMLYSFRRFFFVFWQQG